MKEIKTFKVGDQIPSDAKFLSCETRVLRVEGDGIDAKWCVFFYEIPIKKESKPSPDKDYRVDNIIGFAVAYLNDKAGKKFKDSSKKTRDLIRARINDGFDQNDFAEVINKKSAEWLTDPSMNQYLRPETLFGTKFESYLNAKTGQEMNEDVFGELDKITGQDQ